MRITTCILIATATLLACTAVPVPAQDPDTNQRILELETENRSLEESLETLTNENAELTDEVAALQQQLDELQAKTQWDTSEKGLSSKDKVEQKSPTQSDDTALETTIRLIQDSGGVIHYIGHPGRQNRTLLLMPREFVDGQTPLIVSLHGYGGNSAYQSAYIPLHERVNSHTFALLLPNASRNSQGNRFWNPTDHCCEGGKTGQNDIAYLTDLVTQATNLADFGPVYFFGYSNGGFMSHHIACKGLPGLRAVASLAGTSYVEDSSCDGASPVSVLHIHGTEDTVIRYEGDETEPDFESPQQADTESALYASAQDMVTRWSQLTDCQWPENPQPYATLDLDQQVNGPETQAFRPDAACPNGIDIQLWAGIGSSHTPDYRDAFVDTLLDWLLSQH